MQDLDPSLQRFVAQLAEALATGRCDKLLLANYHGEEPALQRVLGRPVMLRGAPHLSLVWRYQTKDITKNLPLAEAVPAVQALLGMQGFRNAHLHTPGQELQLAFSKKGKGSLRTAKLDEGGGSDDDRNADRNAVSEAAGGTLRTDGKPDAHAHNRAKHRLLELSRPFLHELGVTDAQGQLIPAMSRKWKQINKFIEVFAAALERSTLAEREDIHVVDFGSGKGYLTFALHDWLRHSMGREAVVTGVELREDLVQLCRRVIGKLHLEGMDYEQGDVRHYHPARLDVMIALHACDVATDYAIHLGIRAGAEIILCSPCCHKEIRPQLLSPHPLRPLLKHGIHQTQEAEMLTDGLRAMLLDAVGYDTQVFEFISLEHTSKNKMILAVKRAAAKPAGEVVQQVSDLKAFYGIQAQCLETLLKADGLLPA
jgi:Methyltransferase domain